MGISYQGRSIQKQSDVGLRLEKLPFVDYTNYDETTGLGAVESVINWLVADNNLYSSSVEFDKETSASYSASYFLPTPINISGSFYGSLFGTATSASYVLSASYAPTDSSSLYTAAIFSNPYLILYKGGGTADFIDLSALTIVSASYATTASYALNGGGSGTPTFPYTGSAIISGSLIITGSLQVGVSGTNAATIDTAVGTLSRGGVASVDWVNRSLYDSTGGPTVDWEGMILNNPANADSVDWGNRWLYNSSGVTALDWDNLALYDNATFASMDWNARFLYDSAGNRSHNYDARALIYPNGTSTALSYGTQDRISMSGSVFVTGSLTVSGSSTFRNIGPTQLTGSLDIIGNTTVNGNVTINGTASINYLNVQYETASVIYSSGSNQFGDAPNDVQSLYGTVQILTGSLSLSGSIFVSGSNYVRFNHTGSGTNTNYSDLSVYRYSTYDTPALKLIRPDGIGFNLYRQGSTSGVWVGDENGNRNMTMYSNAFGAFTFVAPGSGGDFSFTGGDATTPAYASSIVFKTNDYTINAATSSDHSVKIQGPNVTGSNPYNLVSFQVGSTFAEKAAIRYDGGAYFSGSVGIGTTTASAALHISGSSGSALLKVDSNSSSNIIYVSGSGFVGIGTSAPNAKLDVAGAIRTSTIVYTNNVYSSAASNTFLNLNGTTNATLGLHNANMPFIFSVTGGSEIMRISGSGNVGIGISAPAARLHVSGSSGSVLFEVDSNTASNIIYVSGSGTVGIGNTGVVNTALAITANGAGGGNYIVQGYDSGAVNRFLVTATGRLQMTGTTDTGTSGTDERVRLTYTFSPTSGTREHYGMYLVHTINQTGGANGITRGLYIQPTLTAAADYRAIETTAGSVIFSGTSSSLTVGTSSLGSTENTIVVGPPPAGGAGEGGQILLQASITGGYTSASMIDNYQNQFRVLRGTNAGSDAFKLSVNMHTGQVQIPNYNSPTAFTGSAVAGLGVDSNGNVVSSTRTARYGTALSGSTIGTGVTAQTIVYSQLIPANTWGADDIFRTYFRFRKLATNGNATYNILVNTSNAVAGATTLATLTANTVHNHMKRDFYIAQGGATTSVGSGVSSNSDDVSNTQTISNITWTSDQYLIYTVTLSTLDSGYGLGYTIEQVL